MNASGPATSFFGNHLCAYKKAADSGEKGRGRMIDTPFPPKDVDCKGFESEHADFEILRCVSL
jgi:hypothetical protein